MSGPERGGYALKIETLAGSVVENDCPTQGHSFKAKWTDPKRERCMWCGKERRMPLLRRLGYWLVEKHG